MVSYPAVTLVLTLLCVQYPDVTEAFNTGGFHNGGGTFTGPDVDGQIITRSSGQAGEECPPNRFKCGKDASCNDGFCQCNAGTHGHPHISCVPDNTFITMVVADPTVHMYDGTKAHINLPCRCLLTEIISRHSMGRDGGLCKTKVHTLIHQIDHGYYVLGFDLTVTISDQAQGKEGNTQLRIYGYGEHGEYKFKEQGKTDKNRKFKQWGKATSVRYLNAIIQTRYDLDNNLAIVDLQECGVHVTFRGHVKYTNQMPGLVVAIDKDMATGFPQDNNPLSGSPSTTDGAVTLTTMKHALHLDKVDAVLYSALIQDTDQDFGPAAISCNVAKREYQRICSTKKKRAFALRQCGHFYTDSSIQECLKSGEFGETSGSLYGMCCLAMCMDDFSLCNFLKSELVALKCEIPQRLADVDCLQIEAARDMMFPDGVPDDYIDGIHLKY